jgi:hypothetical protein
MEVLLGALTVTRLERIAWVLAGKGVSILVLLEAGDHEMPWPGVARTPKSPAGQQPRVPKWKPPLAGFARQPR